MKSIHLDNEMDIKRKLLWCLFWANRKAIRTEGCAPFLIDGIVTSDASYAPEFGQVLRLSNEILQNVEKELKVGNQVKFKITIGEENFDIAFEKNIFSVSTKRNKEMEEEIIESLHEELKRGKLKICPSFPQRVGVDIHL